MFADKVKIKVKGGDGGRGCVSFRREKYVPFGGPDGGDGGNGGSVFLEASENVANLNAFIYKPHYEAKRGEHGKGKQRHGKNALDIVLKVPIGTQVKDLATGEILADLTEHGQRFCAAAGGVGGKGNMHFATSTNRAPRKTTDPTPGEERELELELKIIADVGLIGYPNAGKSSLLTAVTNARPETAPYPFTTRHPQVGIVEFDDLYRFTMADIPGIIEGAHENRGLGFEFLRHIERTSILVYVLDMAGTDGRTPWDDLDSLHEELREYNPELLERPSIIAANKMDEPNAEENLERLREHTQLPVFPICAILNEGCPELLQALRRLKEEQKYN